MKYRNRVSVICGDVLAFVLVLTIVALTIGISFLTVALLVKAVCWLFSFQFSFKAVMLVY